MFLFGAGQHMCGQVAVCKKTTAVGVRNGRTTTNATTLPIAATLGDAHTWNRNRGRGVSGFVSLTIYPAGTVCIHGGAQYSAHIAC